MFQRRFVSGSLFVSPFPPEFYLKSETKIGPELRLTFSKIKIRSTSTLNLTLNDLIIVFFSSVWSTRGVLSSGAPNENIVQNHLLNIALLNVFWYLNGRYRHIFIP